MLPAQSSLAISEAAPSRFDACRPYWPDITAAVERRFPAEFQYPLAWTAQLYQESLCKPDAISHAGAGGIAQIMKPTARYIAGVIGVDFDRMNAAQAIDAGAFYQAKRMNTFMRRNRTGAQAYELGAASYNSGLHNVLKSQRLCDNARLWKDVQKCQPKVTGRHAAETITYVTRIKRWTNEMGDSEPWNVPDDWRKEVTDARTAAIEASLPVRRVFDTSSWCTYYPLWGGWVSAGHCEEEFLFDDYRPPFLRSLDVRSAKGVIDAVFYGVTLPKTPPPAPVEGQLLETVGFPAGSNALAYRNGRIYVKRSEGGEAFKQGGWIIILEAGPRPTFEREPVVGGQSGSPGIDARGNPVCIVVNQNSLADLTGDGIPDNSFDCVALRDVWEVLK